MTVRFPAALLCCCLLLTGCLGGPPPDVPYGRGGMVEGTVITDAEGTQAIPFDSPAVQSDEHVRAAVVGAVESPSDDSTVTFDAGEGESVYDASQRLSEYDAWVEHGHPVSYRNHTVSVRIHFYS